MLFKQILSGINYMHSKKLCHRDIKPQNIILTSNGDTIKIADFSISKYFKTDHNETINMITDTGTIQYRAPETFLHQKYTYNYIISLVKRSIYGVQVLFYMKCYQAIRLFPVISICFINIVCQN